MSANSACVVPVLGATGSGKSAFLRRYLAQKKVTRSMVWNPMQKKTRYDGDEVTSLADLVERTRSKRFRVVFVPVWDFEVMREQFDVFCEVALERENLVFVAEELKHVTRPQWAPAHWRRVTGDGRQYGLRVFGATQRPAQVDGDFLGNATIIRTGRLVKADDIDVVTKYMRVERSQIEALAPLDWLEKDMETGRLAAGRLTF